MAWLPYPLASLFLLHFFLYLSKIIFKSRALLVPVDRAAISIHPDFREKRLSDQYCAIILKTGSRDLIAMLITSFMHFHAADLVNDNCKTFLTIDYRRYSIGNAENAEETKSNLIGMLGHISPDFKTEGKFSFISK